jgi:serine protease AprX
VSEHSSWRPEAPGLGVTWGGQPLHARRAATIAAAAAVIFGMAAPVTAQAASTAAPVSVIVRELDGAGNAPEHAVEHLGGTVGQSLGIIHGFNATVPADRLDALRSSPGVFSVSENAAVTLNEADTAAVQDVTGSLYRITHDVTGATHMWERGALGQGVDVALIDSGVVPVNGLRQNVIQGPDLSFEAQVCDASGCTASPTQHLDTYGHGTAMAGIIAGRDDNASPRTYMNPDTFIGMAPASRIVSIKVADATGATDVSQVIAGIEWVVKNRRANGMNIRVLNLSFGTDGVQDYKLDPLTYATEVAWRAGIVVVVSAGNGGYGTTKLNNPAYDPYVIAVGGADSRGTYDVMDDVVPSWSSTGDGNRNPDVVAPGAGVISLRSAGSYLDQAHPNARIGERFLRGSGTSQAAAVTSGAAALLLSQRPNLTNDQVKWLLTHTAQHLPVADARAQGAGIIDLERARVTQAPWGYKQNHPRATGLGSLDKARGTHHISFQGTELAGEFDVTGRAWNPAVWAPAAAAGLNWSGAQYTASGWLPGVYRGLDWYATPGSGGSGLDGITWSGITWSGITWSGITWSGITWSGITWSGITWSGITWSGITWSGITWSGITWSGITWSGATWGA